VLTALSGLVLSALGFTGLAMWWQRRSVRRAQLPRAARTT
jgi:uncharacterized iron-regulated membrane protein